MRQTSRLRFPPAVGLPGPARAQQAAPRNSGLGGRPRRRVTETGREGQAPPAQGAGDHREAERAHRARGRSPQPRPASRPRRRRGPGAPLLPRRPAQLPRGPVLPSRRGRAPTRGKATFQPGARRPEPRQRREGEERRREGDTAWAGARDFQKPS